MSHQDLEQGNDNAIVRNQEVYAVVPQDVIDRMGNTATQLLTEADTCLEAINELKSNLTDLGTMTTLADVGFTTNNESSDITLSDDYTNYEFILIQFKVAGEYRGSILLQSGYITPTGSETNNSNIVTIWHSSNYHASLRIQFKSTTTFRHYVTESVGWVSATAKNVKILGINKKSS